VAPPGISGSAVVGDTLTASTGEWTGSPTSYTYDWQDCDALGEGCLSASGPGGSSGASYGLTAGDLNSAIRVLVSAGNAHGTTSAMSAPTATVLAVPPPPVNSTPPVVSGSPQEGKQLSASAGTWTGSPTAYGYRWRVCDSAGANCSAIAGAESSSLVLHSSEVGHTVRVVVTASNAEGATEASSAPTEPVKAKEKKQSKPTNCFENPESEGTARFEACGYPGPHNTAVQDCAALGHSSGSKVITTEGETVENTDITGSLIIDASHVTLNHDCVIANGGGIGGSAAIWLESTAASFTISDTTVRAENATTDWFEEAISNDNAASGVPVVAKDVFEDCGECLHGSFEVSESYVIADAGLGKAGGLHREPWYLNNGTAIGRDDTILDPENQTAIIFANVANGVEHVEACSDHVTLENSFVAGSGQMIQTCGPRATGPGTATLTVKNDRLARCLTPPIADKKCSGSGFEGADSHGYFPNGGWISVLGEPPYGAVVWEDNYWDNNLEEVRK
jgi:hypothetical protein